MAYIVMVDVAMAAADLQLFYSTALLAWPTRSSLNFVRRALRSFSEYRVDVVETLQELSPARLAATREVKWRWANARWRASSYGPYSYCLYIHGLYSYGLYSYGLM